MNVLFGRDVDEYLIWSRCRWMSFLVEMLMNVFLGRDVKECLFPGYTYLVELGLLFGAWGTLIT